MQKEVGILRKYSILKEPVNDIKKVMIYEMKDGVYVFLYNTDKDVAGFADHWYETLKEAEEECSEIYGIGQKDWIIIPDPLEFCQHDIIAPVRVKGRNTGNPQWGKCEQLINGKWVEVKL